MKARDIQPAIHANTERGSAVYTDSLAAYRGLKHHFEHGVIDHSKAYVDGLIHTNGLENFWSCLKRTIKGTYVSVDPIHVFRYLDEQTFRFNNRKENDAFRFSQVVSMVVGKRLTYNSLIGADLSPATT